MHDRPCSGCGAELPKGARLCKECKTLRGATGECVVCRSPIREDAKKCTSCGSYQGIRRIFGVSSATLSAAAALVSVISLSITVAANLPRSSTSAMLLGATKEAVLIGFDNSGSLPSSVREIPRIDVDDKVLTIDNLRPHADDQAKLLLKPRDAAVIRYIIGSVTLNAKAAGKPFWATYGKTMVHLRIAVDESSGSRTRTDDVRLDELKLAISEKCDLCKDE